MGYVGEEVMGSDTTKKAAPISRLARLSRKVIGVEGVGK
jgi:hypothetical protein